MRIVKVAVLVSAWFLAGCATQGQFSSVEKTSSDQTVLYVYRPHSPPVLRKPEIRINGVVLGDLAQWEYFGLTLAPGQYRVEVDWAWDTLITDSSLNVDLERKRPYYIRVVSDVSGVYFVGSPVMTFGGSANAVSEAQALEELKRCHPVMSFDPTKLEVSPL